MRNIRLNRLYLRVDRFLRFDGLQLLLERGKLLGLSVKLYGLDVELISEHLKFPQ